MITLFTPPPRFSRVVGDIRELTYQWNLQNKNQEIREHICDLAENKFGYL